MSTVRGWVFILFAAAFACIFSVHAQNLPGPAASVFAVGPWISGAWYDPARSGEGIIVEALPSGGVLAVWFTYPAVDEPGQQAWLVADSGRIAGDRVRFASVLRPRGGRFGDAFDPAKIERAPWGDFDLSFTGCNTMQVRYGGPANAGSGTRTMTRLTRIADTDCNAEPRTQTNGARALATLQAKSGAWYVPSRSGEGWLIEELPDGRGSVYWFTYDLEGQQAFVVGTGSRVGNRLEITDAVSTRGTRFGDAFNAAAVERIPWGSISIDFQSCSAARITFASTIPGYGSGTRDAVRLTDLASSTCLDRSPEVALNGAWVEEAAMPTPAQSEHATTVLDGQLYVLGGYGDPRGFKRFDPASNAWARLADLPGGRDHLAAFAIEGGVYMVGGEPNTGGDGLTAAFRYDVARNLWEARPEIGTIFGSHAAVLNGMAYIGEQDGTLQEYDPRNRVVRRLKADPAGRARDHSQVVAFDGEIWIISGRSPETTSVVIYDPAREQWRVGPSLQRARGGFAAAVLGHQIIVAGGEIVNGALRLEGSVEVFTAGGDGWKFAQPLPVPVHGVSGGVVNGRFYVVSGSTQAGQTFGATGRVFSIKLLP